MLLASRCGGCGRPGPSPCRACWVALEPPPVLPPPAGLDVLLALVAYAGPGRDLVARLKYRNDRAALGWLAGALAGLVGALPEPPGPGTVVTWAPTTRARRKERGFDHAALLAAATARRLGLPVAPLLERRPGPPQTGRSAHDRRTGPTFTLRGPAPTTVVLVDDVATTGATLGAAARALRAGGTTRVLGVVAARTPLKRSTANADHSA